MATLLHSSKLSDSKYKNWIKAGLGVLYTKEGIEPFVYDEIEKFQQKCLSDICNNNGLPAGTVCSSCCTENVVVCPTNGICNVRRGKCTFHRNSATRYLPSGCPNKICHHFKNEIQKAHRYYGPSYKNTDASQWCSNPWEVAKCFMPPDGYNDVTSAADTDFNGTISVILNYEAFQSQIQDDLSKKKSSIFEKGRDIGKSIRHSAQYRIEDVDLQEYFTVLHNLLSDPKYLSTNTAAQDAKTKLIQLQNDTLVIGKDDVHKVLNDVGDTIKDKIRTEKDEFKKDADIKKLELKKIIKHAKRTITNEAKKEIKKMKLETDAVVTKINKALTAKKDVEYNTFKEDVDTVEYSDSSNEDICEGAEGSNESEIYRRIPKMSENAADQFPTPSPLSGASLNKTDARSKEGHLPESAKQHKKSNGSRRNVKTLESSSYQYKTLAQMFSSPKDKSRRKCTHEGRLLTLEPTKMKTILQVSTKRIAGGFGEVFISDVPGLDIKVAVKKIEAKSNMNEKLRSMTNEKLASRTMHFAIVPILVNCTEENENTTTCYFLSPYFEKGDLFDLIKRDTAAVEDNKSVELNKHTRMKIIYHVSSAIEFLHRTISKLRGPIIHLDVKSKNIVLDQFYNARLTDFGVSREIAEDEEFIKTYKTGIPETDGYLKIGRTDTLEKYFDCVNVGIVIRELLSGLPPIFPENKYLKDIKTMNVFKRKVMKIWTTEEVKSLFELSDKCITNSSISAEDMVTEIEKLLRSGGTAKWNRANDSLKCEMCIVNPSVEEKLISHEMSCTCPLRVCVSCMRNEYLNPILCHSCGTGATVIDSANWGAILIAGIDEANADCSKLWLKDIKDIRDVIISKFPLVIGMRKENVKVLKTIQKSPTVTTGHMVRKIRGAFEELKTPSVHTLFIYFSGHYTEENGFLVGYGNEYLTKEDLKRMIENFSEKEVDNKPITSLVRFIVILDCCAGPRIASDSLNLNVNTSVVQINACRSNERAFALKDGSIFKRFFVQGLTSKATKEPCYIQKLKSQRMDAKDQTLCCSSCPIKGEDFVTVENLHSYICDHLREFSEVNGLSCTLPVINSRNMKCEDAILGYLFDSDVCMQFLLRYKEEGRNASCEIPHQFYRDMTQLRTLLFLKYMEKLDVTKTLKADDFKDICCIEIELGPKAKHKKEVKTIEQLNSAWNAKREIVVSLRDISMIRYGMVGSFIETEKMRNYLFNNDYERIGKPNWTVVILNCGELDEILEKEDSISYGEFFQKLEALSEAIDELDKKVSRLHIRFPRTEDGSHRPDFVCFELEYDRSDEQKINTEQSSGTSVGHDNNLVKSDSQDQET